MAQPKSANTSLREKFHDINNALQGMSNLIVVLRRDETYTPDIGALLESTFTRVKAAVDAARAEAVEGISETSGASRPSLPERFSVLLIDPDPLSRRMSATRLKALGYTAVLAEGEAAAQRELSANADIKAALIDVIDGPSTAKLCASLLKNTPGLPIILSHHESAEPLNEKLLGFEPIGTLRKPLKAHRVAEMIERIGRKDSIQRTIRGREREA